MKGTNRLGLFLATVAAAVILAMPAGAALAADVPSATAGDGKKVEDLVVITKVIEASQQANVAGDYFQIKFTPDGLDDGSGTKVESSESIPNFGDANGLVKTGTAQAMTGEKQVVTTTIPSTAWPRFTHAGVYRYLVKENVPSGSENSLTAQNDTSGHPVNIYKPSQAQYLMRVYVVNSDDGPVIQKVTVDQQALDVPAGDDTETADNPGQIGNNSKIDPTDPKTTTPDDSDSDPEIGNGFKFTNRFSQFGHLTITKRVASSDPSKDYANKEQKFLFDVKIIIPEKDLNDITETQTGVGSDEKTAKSISAHGMVTPGEDQNQGQTDRHFIFGYSKAKGAPNAEATTTDSQNQTLKAWEAEITGIELVHNTSLSFGDNLPVGTKVYVKEHGASNYTASASVKVGNAAAVNLSSGTKGQDYVIPADEAYEVVRDGLTITITNTFDSNSVSPTGILINNLPYILLIGIPVVALIAWFVVRRRKAAVQL